MNTIDTKRVIMKRLRITNGLSIRRLAQITKLNASTIQKIETHKSRPNPSTALKICKALGVKFDEIFEVIEK